MSNAPPPGSDPIYKRLYAFARMVEDLLRSLFTDAELGADYNTLEKLPTEYVGDALQQRRGDTAWRLRARAAGGGWLHVLVMLEFQSNADSAMALRVLEYTALLYGELLRRGTAPGALPPVLPVVLYNGDAPWRPATEMRELIAPPPPALAPYQPSQRHVVLDQRRARAEDFKLHGLTWAVAQLEQSRSEADLARAAQRLAALLGGAGQGELRRTFSHWLWALSRGMDGDPARQPRGDLDLEEMAVSLEDRVREWRKPYIQQGREEGIKMGREQGISLGREQGISLGREQGINLGREQAMEHERQLLRHLAAARFDSATADRLAAAIGGEADPHRLMEVGEAIVRCKTGSELLRKVDSRR